MTAFSTLDAFVAHLQSAVCEPHAPDEPWTELIRRISVPDQVTAIDQATFDWFLEVLPPKFQIGSLFAFAEGSEPLRLFWRRAGRYFARQLTWEETRTFCTLAHMALPH